MAVIEHFTGTEAVGATEHSLTTDTAGPDVETMAGTYDVFLDLSDMVAGDELQIRVYEKVRSGDTQRILKEYNLVGAQATPNWSLTGLKLLNGWDITLDALAGTITVLWSIREDLAGCIQVGTLTGVAAQAATLKSQTAPTADLFRGALLEIPLGQTGGGQVATVTANTSADPPVCTLDRAWITQPTGARYRLYAGPFPSTVAEIRTEIDANSTQLAKLGTPAGASISADLLTLLGADTAYKKNVAVTAFVFPMKNTDGTAATGKTVTTQVSKDGGAFATLAGSVTEISGGWYKVDIAQAEMNADEIGFKATATGCDQTNIKIRTQS